MRSALCGALVLVACGAAVEEVSGTSSTTTVRETGTSSSGDVPDLASSASVLFIVSDTLPTDRSVELASAVEAFATALEGVDVRIAFAKASAEHPLCGTSPNSPPAVGAFVATSCRDRPEDFDLGEVTDTSCIQACSAEFNLDGSWFEAFHDGTSNVSGASFSEAVACASLQGINGCGNQPLWVLSRAIERSGTVGTEEEGFFREGSLPVVVMVSSLDDCSFNDAFESVFLPGGESALWNGSEPSAAICWNASTQCAADGTCVATNRLPDGEETDGDGVLRSVAGFVAQLESLGDASGHAPLVLPLAGAPRPPLAAGAEASPDYFERFGVDPVCGGTGDAVFPTVRLQALSAGFSGGIEMPLLCDGQQEPLGQLAQLIRERVS